jgi:DNA-binding NarL/FixJ family response regulator
MAQKVRVLIIDDHPLFRQGIRWSLEEAGDMEVVGEAENGQEAIKLAERLLPDVVLVDINLPGLNGLEVARVIKRREPRIGMVVLSVYEDDDQLFQAIKVGAAAYSSKDVHPAELLRMIREVARGHYLINDSVLAKPHVATRVLHQFRELAATEDEQTSVLFDRNPRLYRARPVEQGDRQRAVDQRPDRQEPYYLDPLEAPGQRPHHGRDLCDSEGLDQNGL